VGGGMWQEGWCIGSLSYWKLYNHCRRCDLGLKKYGVCGCVWHKYVLRTVVT
jgi:hypothetical protein